jgi:hypothetical protein
MARCGLFTFLYVIVPFFADYCVQTAKSGFIFMIFVTHYCDVSPKRYEYHHHRQYAISSTGIATWREKTQKRHQKDENTHAYKTISSSVQLQSWSRRHKYDLQASFSIHIVLPRSKSVLFITPVAISQLSILFHTFTTVNTLNMYIYIVPL